ncbi:type II toxin-antitoxin system toxin ribonuclease C26 [soil metagenome]
MIIADTSGLLALFDRDDQAHVRVDALLATGSPTLVVSPFVLAELDHLVVSRVGVDEEVAMLQAITGGRFELAPFDREDLVAATTVITRYRDQAIGVTDASLLVLADRYRTDRILTLDERHFRVLGPLAGGSFRILPADA